MFVVEIVVTVEGATYPMYGTEFVVYPPDVLYGTVLNVEAVNGTAVKVAVSYPPV